MEPYFNPALVNNMQLFLFRNNVIIRMLFEVYEINKKLSINWRTSVPDPID